MKQLSLVLSIFLFALPIQAQGLFSKPSKAELIRQNDSLKAYIDSLYSVIDSLYNSAAEEEVIAQLLEEEEIIELQEDTLEYSTEVSDSLLHLWYQNALNGDVEIVNEYNMDSVRFVSNISNEEMAKRLENMNSFISLPFNDNVKNYIILYSEKMNERMSRVMGLSEYYFPIFEEVFSRYGIPLELKYMAIIESMLNPVARSRAGAMGIWQFMYGTARNYKLMINSYIDERLDVEKAVDAAARYLKDAYQVFGDWALAISSYNCGAGNVSKAIRRSGGKRDFWSIYPFLPRETRGYVPAFVGAMYAFHYASDYGLSPANVGMPAQTDTFHIHKNLHFKQISEVIGVPEEDLRNLNPQYSHQIIPGSSLTCVLKLPYNYTNAFLDIPRDSLYAYKTDSLFTDKVIKDVAQYASGSNDRITYKVKNGDYLGKIASRYGVSVKKLQTWNGLKGTNIRVGQTLYIYRGGAGPSANSTSNSSQKSTASSETKASAAKAAATATSQATKGQESVYTVKNGDSLYTIAKLFPGVSAQNIKDYNGLKTNNIKPGQKLKIPRL